MHSMIMRVSINEAAKKREYDQRVQNVEYSVFTPLVFSTTGSMGKEGTTFYKRLADMLSRKQEKPYSVVMGSMRCRLSFAITRSSVLINAWENTLRHDCRLHIAHVHKNVYGSRDFAYNAGFSFFFTMTSIMSFFSASHHL